MPDTVTVQTLIDGKRNFVVKLTNFSDGTGENQVKKIDATKMATYPPGVGMHMKIWSYAYDIKNMNVRIQWDGAPVTDALILGGFANAIDCSEFGGIVNNAPNPTGNVLLTTNGQQPGSSYTIILTFIKGI